MIGKLRERFSKDFFSAFDLFSSPAGTGGVFPKSSQAVILLFYV